MLLSQMSNPASRDLNKTQSHPKLEYDEVVPDHDDDSTEEDAAAASPARSVARSLATSNGSPSLRADTAPYGTECTSKKEKRQCFF